MLKVCFSPTRSFMDTAHLIELISVPLEFHFRLWVFIAKMVVDCGSMALPDNLSMPEEDFLRLMCQRPKSWQKGIMWLELFFFYQMAQHSYQLCDTWGEGKASQPDAASVKEQKATHKHVLISPPWGSAETASEDTSWYAKSQLTHNNWLSPTPPRTVKDISKSIKIALENPLLKELFNKNVTWPTGWWAWMAISIQEGTPFW